MGRFTLALTFDPAWKARPVSIARGPILPGQTVVVTQDLTWRGEGAMPVDRPAPQWVGFLVAAALPGGIAFLITEFVRLVLLLERLRIELGRGSMGGW